MFGVENPTFANLFRGFGPRPFFRENDTKTSIFHGGGAPRRSPTDQAVQADQVG